MKRFICLICFVLLLLTMSAFIDSFDAFADTPTVKATGILTLIEDDGTVIIDEKGYKVDPSVMVLNRRGNPVSLGSLSLPAAIWFEYVQAKTGFIIVFIKQVKSKEVANKRSLR